MIVDSTDVSDDGDSPLSDLVSINMVTGITAGTNTIVPAAMLSDNFDITYGLGHLTILPAPLTVQALDTTSTYGLPAAYRDSIYGYQYADSAGSVFANLPTNSLSDASGNAINGSPGAGQFKIVPGGAQLNVPSNYSLTYLNGNLLVNKAVLNAFVTDTSRLYGQINPVFKISYSGFINGDDISAITTKPVAGTLATSSSPVGTYPITLTGGSSAQYTIAGTSGVLTVTPAPLTATANNQTRIYGDPNPPFTISYLGFVNNESPSVLTTLPSVNSTAILNSPVGSYPITVNGGLAANYTIQDINGNLIVTPAALTVKADDKWIDEDDNLPGFTSTITGFKNGESNTITCQPSYTVTPVYKKNHPGVYTITPYGLQLKYANNYLISYLTGNLYVNAINCRNVIPQLVCVQTLTGDPSGYNYAAHFSYNNPNSTIVYVPYGSNNKITVSGGYVGLLPFIFLPGTGQFTIYFNGSK